MPHYATLRDYQFKDRADDIRGATLYGVDGDKLGTINDVIFEHGSGVVKYCVVDTGGWLSSSKKFLVPAERIHSFDRDPEALQVDLLKEHIERVFPPYDEKTIDRDEDWHDYEDRYQRSAKDNRIWESGPVLHRQDSTHIITPETTEIGGGVAETGGADVTPTRLAGKFPSTMPGAGKVDLVPKGSRPVERSVSFGNEAIVSPEGGSKVENISSSREFRPAADVPPMGSLGEDIQPIAEPNVARPNEPVVEVGSRRGLGPAMREDVRSRSERWSRFEDLLRKNRVDIEAKCAQCAPARDRKVG